MISQGFNSRACGYARRLGEDFTLLRAILRAVILTAKHRSNGRLLKKTFYGCCQVLFFFFSRRLAHSLSGDVGQVVILIIRFMVFPEHKNNFQPLSSQSSNRLVVGMSFRALLTIVHLRPFALVKRSKSQPVDGVTQALIAAKAKMYYPNFSALFSQRDRSCLSLKMPEGLPPSWSIAYLSPHTRQCRTAFGSGRPLTSLAAGMEAKKHWISPL